MSYSGKLNVRMPTDLHAHLAKDAARHGVSLNHRIVVLLAGSSGFKRYDDDLRDAMEEQRAQDRASAESAEFVRRHG